MNKVSGGELVAIALKNEGVQEFFGLVGNHVSPIFVHCEKHNLRIFDVRHEQAAVHMADGYAQSSRKIGVAIIV